MENKKIVEYYYNSILLLFATILYFIILFIGNYAKDLESIDAILGIIIVIGSLIPIFIAPILMLIQFVQMLFSLYTKNWSASKHHFFSILITFIIFIFHMKYTNIGVLAQQ